MIELIILGVMVFIIYKLKIFQFIFKWVKKPFVILKNLYDDEVKSRVNLEKFKTIRTINFKR